MKAIGTAYRSEEMNGIPGFDDLMEQLKDALYNILEKGEVRIRCVDTYMIRREPNGAVFVRLESVGGGCDA